MRYLECYDKIFKNHSSYKRFFISGASATGKTTLAIEVFKDLINNNKIDSTKVLSLIMNRYQEITWKSNMEFEVIGEVRRSTYYGFIRRELIKYWPYILEKCDEIESKKLKPEFASIDISNYTMKLLVEKCREREGYFSEIKSTSTRIAKDLIDNMNKCAMYLGEFEEIGQRIFNSLEIKEFLKKELYDQMDEVIYRYRSNLLKRGVVDYSLAIYVYNKYLINHEEYEKRLRDIEYIIVDDINEASPAQLQLTFKIMENAKGVYFFENEDGGFASFYGADYNYFKKSLKDQIELRSIQFEELNIDNSFSCNDEISSCAEALKDRILGGNLVEDFKNITVDKDSQLRSEMIEKIKYKIEELLCKGYRGKDIVVICPLSDKVLVNEIKNVAVKFGCSITETSKKVRYIEEKFINILVVLSVLCNDYRIHISQEELQNMFSVLLGIDMVRSSILAKQIIKISFLDNIDEETKKRIGVDASSRYDYIKLWIDNYKSERKTRRIMLPQFFRKAFLELMIKVEGGKESVELCKELCESAENFIGMLEILGIGNENTYEESFIRYMKSDLKEFDSNSKLEENISNENNIIITSTYSYLTSNLSNKIQIWTDINSNMWCMGNVKELSNPFVLRKGWPINEVYGDAFENQNIRENLAKVIKCIARKSSEHIFVYGSEYSLNGYDEYGVLGEIF